MVDEESQEAASEAAGATPEETAATEEDKQSTTSKTIISQLVNEEDYQQFVQEITEDDTLTEEAVKEAFEELRQIVLSANLLGAWRKRSIRIGGVDDEGQIVWRNSESQL